MLPTLDHLDRFILRSVCEELLSLERIMGKAEIALARDQIDRVPDRLLSLISRRLVDAYLLRAGRSFATRAEDPDISRHWFFISKRGVRLLMDLQSQPDAPDILPLHFRLRSRKTPGPGKLLEP